MYIKLNSYTNVNFENRQPNFVYWELTKLIDLKILPKNSELIKEVKKSLLMMGWNVKVSKPENESCSDLSASIQVIESKQEINKENIGYLCS